MARLSLALTDNRQRQQLVQTAAAQAHQIQRDEQKAQSAEVADDFGTKFGVQKAGEIFGRHFNAGDGLVMADAKSPKPMSAQKLFRLFHLP
jgi:hypothetical protein